MKFVSTNQNDSLAITMYIVTVAMSMSFLGKVLCIILKNCTKTRKFLLNCPLLRKFLDPSTTYNNNMYILTLKKESANGKWISACG